MAVWRSTFATTKISYLHNVILDVWPSLIKPPNINCLLGPKLSPLQNTGRFFFFKFPLIFPAIWYSVLNFETQLTITAGGESGGGAAGAFGPPIGGLTRCGGWKLEEKGGPGPALRSLKGDDLGGRGG